MADSGVYEILNTISGNRYVGSAVDIRGRKNSHLSMLRRSVHFNPYLQNAWNKYGEDAFVFKVLHVLYPVNLLAIEQGEIDTKSEYNICKVAGNCLGVKASDEHKAKISAALKGKKKTAEHIANAAAALKGHKHTLEARANMSAAHMGYVTSDETKAKLAVTSKKAAAIHKKNGTGFWSQSTEQLSANGKKHYEMGTGIFGMTKEQKREGDMKGIATQMKNGIGIHGFTTEQRVEIGRKSGKRCYEMGAGIHALTSEQLSENAKKNRKRTPSEIHLIRRLTLDGMSSRELGRLFGVARSTISRIVSGKTYTDV